jgi:hypothetical protein
MPSLPNPSARRYSYTIQWVDGHRTCAAAYHLSGCLPSIASAFYWRVAELFTCFLPSYQASHDPDSIVFRIQSPLQAQLLLYRRRTSSLTPFSSRARSKDPLTGVVFRLTECQSFQSEETVSHSPALPAKFEIQLG